MAMYIHADNLAKYIDARIEHFKSQPQVCSALMDVQMRFVVFPDHFGYTTMGDCDGCRWKGRHQKCSCCRRNPGLKDCYEVEP